MAKIAVLLLLIGLVVVVIQGSSVSGSKKPVSPSSLSASSARSLSGSRSVSNSISLSGSRSVSGSTSPSAAGGKPQTCNILFGSYTSTAPWVNEPWINDGMNATAAVDNLIGRSSYIVQWYQNWGDGSGDWNNNVLPYLKIALNFTSANAPNSHMALLTWQPWGPHFSTSGTIDYPLVGIANGSFDSYIDTWANGAAALNYTIFLRPMHEMDGWWYPWGQVNGNTAAQYIAAWQHIYSRFALAGATKNVKFVWCPNNSNNGIDQTTFYPGDAYVDWIGLDAYAATYSNSFRSTINESCNPPYPYQRLVNKAPSKPMMIAEFGINQNASTPAGVYSWFTQLSQDLALFPNIAAMVYFNADVYNLTHSPQSIAGAKVAFGTPCTGIKFANANSDGHMGGSSSQMSSWIRHLFF